MPAPAWSSPRSRSALLALLLAARSGSAADVHALAIGERGPEFRIEALDSSRLGFAEATRSHRAVAIVFLSVLCPYANLQMTELRELDDAFRDAGLLIVGLDSNRTESVAELRSHVTRHAVRFPVAADLDNRIADLLGAHVTPEVFLFDGDGRLRYRGRVMSKYGAPDLRKAVEAVLEGRRVSTPVARPFGCAIVRNRALRLP